jgi:hypothetical protein
MPNGKLAGVRCVNLDDQNACRLHGSSSYPQVCKDFTPRRYICGKSNLEAYKKISILEKATE